MIIFLPKTQPFVDVIQHYNYRRSLMETSCLDQMHMLLKAIDISHHRMLNKQKKKKSKNVKIITIVRFVINIIKSTS